MALRAFWHNTVDMQVWSIRIILKLAIVRCVVCVEQTRPSQSGSTFQRSFSSPRATVTNGNDRTPSVVGVYRNASLRESSSRPSASRLCARLTSSASSSPSSARRRDDRVGCLATAQVPVTRTSSLTSCRTSVSTAVKSTAASVGRSATLPASRTSMLPTATQSTVKSVNRDNMSTTTVVRQRLKVTQCYIIVGVGRIFESVRLFVCLFVCLSVCLSAA